MADDDQHDDEQADDQADDDQADDVAPELEAIRADPAGAHKTIEALKAEAADYRRRLRATEQERDELQRVGLSEQERAVAEAEARGRAEADAEHGRRLLEAEIRAAAAGKLQDPADAVRYLDLDELLERDDGARELDKAIAKLVDDKPYLAVGDDEPAGTRGMRRSSQGARSTPGGGQSSDQDGSAWLRKAVRRGG